MLERLGLPVWIGLIEFAGGLLVVGYCLAALGNLVRSFHPHDARLLVAEGAIMGLSFKLAATLLNAIGSPSWEHLARLAVMVTLRTLLKRVFAREQGRLRRPER